MPTSNSWKAQGYIDPGLLYQSAFSELDSITGYYDFLLRNYDPALGRWIQVDPYDQFGSPYIGMGNFPHFGIDPDGGAVGGPIVAMLFKILYSKAFVTAATTAAATYATSQLAQSAYQSIGQIHFDNKWYNAYTLPQISGAPSVSIPEIANVSPIGATGVSQAPTTLGKIITNLYMGSLGAKAGFSAGINSTAAFFKGLGTYAGWVSLGLGIERTAHMMSATSGFGAYLRAKTVMDVSNYIQNVPNMSTYEITFDLFYGAEKVVEGALFSKGVGLAGSTLKGVSYASRGGNFLKGGKTFSQYKSSYWATRAKPTYEPIRMSNGKVFKVHTELHHRFIPQRAKWAPNWLKNNRLNLQPLNTIQHGLNDPYRFRFFPKEIKNAIKNGNTFGY